MTPVRIVDVQATCGCTTPEFDRKLVAPGEVASMFARATPVLTGEKLVNITTTTDSPVTPVVVVKLLLIGSTDPPYMGQARGDLTFSGAAATNEPRTIYAHSLEKKGSKPTPPIIKNDLDWLEITGPVIEPDKPSTSPDAVTRKYIYEARIKKSSVAENVSGQVLVIDPWESSHVETISVHREVVPPLMVVPARGVLVGGKDQVAKFVTISAEPITDLVVELDDEAVSALSLTGPTSHGDNHRFAFTVGVKATPAAEQVYYVKVGRSSSTDRLRIPIAVRSEESH